MGSRKTSDQNKFSVDASSTPPPKEDQFPKHKLDDKGRLHQT